MTATAVPHTPPPVQWSESCRVPDCGGALVHDTDGNGGLVSFCSDCERRVRQLRLLRGRVVPRPLAEATDEELALLVRQRFGTLDEVLATVRRGRNPLVEAIEDRTVVSLRVSGRARLIALASARSWAEATARKRKPSRAPRPPREPKPPKMPKLLKRGPRSPQSLSPQAVARIAALPREASAALTLAELHARLPDDTKQRISVWLANNSGRPQLRREGTTLQYRYWWEESA